MKVIFFDSKTYDKESFTKELVNYPDVEVKFLRTELTVNTAELAHGYDAVCAFCKCRHLRRDHRYSSRMRGKIYSAPLCGIQ